ncbi:APC family permease [Streptomyces tubercidicus]|uniref:Amino acid permease n=1 Tax=Streptomyces tubercidicus TaxID=47759 RepID=A0A640UVA8_9ACTN|nr:APC family permease [Streptomyces tubercidicus]WAU12823.1 APC family permease [Streptomyces tubercidicus]GFE38325.1 amino acid permease [Streptomyces tubercidicus]
MSKAAVAGSESAGGARHLRRAVGFWGLMFLSLGSIIGSGWLLGALTTAVIAGPASLLSWVLAAAMLAVLALAHAELGATYPIAGGTARFPFFAFGPLTGFTAGWMSWLRSVLISPIEVEATLSYLDRIGWIHDRVDLLNPNGTLTTPGLVIGTVFMMLFTVINVLGVRLMSGINSVTAVFKTAVPLLTVIVLMTLSFHASNFTAGGGFAPHGTHGVFAALPAGVVFALLGFEQAIQLAGEARNPQRDISRAVVVAMAVGTALYLLLQIAFIAALDPAVLTRSWDNPVGAGNFGPYATLATAVGAGWLATILYIDAVISPAGTGLVYMAGAARLSYAMGRERVLPRPLTQVGRSRVPVVSTLLAFVVGELAFLPFPSWQALVGLVTSAAAIMYAFAPVSLHALRVRDGARHRPYRLPAGSVMAPLGFVFANLIFYWSGYEADWKLGIAALLGFVFLALTRLGTPAAERGVLRARNALWVWPWLIGMILIARFGRYGGTEALPDWWDLAIVIVFSLAIHYTAVRLAMPPEAVDAAVQHEEEGESVPGASSSSGGASGGATG